MTDPNRTPNMPDHATARILTELAAALIPPLQETLSAELTRTVKALPVDIDREVEEVLSSLKRLRVLSEEMANALSSAQNSASQLSDELLPLSRACETMNSASARLARLAAEPEPPADAAQINELLCSIEAGISDWRGVLKANGRAQTQELTEFSAEVSEQVGWMKSALPGVMRDILEKAYSPCAEELSSMSDKNIKILETRLTRLEKIGKMILAGGVVLIILLGVLYFK